MSEPVVHEEMVATSPFITMRYRELIATAIWGAVVGAITVLIYILMYKFVFGAVLCRPQSTGSCAQAPIYATIVAIVISVIAGVAVLARLRVYRPLLVVIAVLASLWGIQNELSGTWWVWSLLLVAMLFGLAYALYAWLARIRHFVLALVVMVTVIVLARWILVA